MKKIILVLFILLLFSCENKSDADDNLFTSVCKTEVFELPENFTPTAVTSLIIDGEYIYVNGFYQTKEIYEPRTYRYDHDGQNRVEADISGNMNTEDYSVGDNETLSVSNVFGDTGREKILITKYIDGEEVFTVDVDNIFDMSVRDLPIDYAGDNYFKITGIAASDGIYYIAGGKKIAVIDSNGNKIALINVTGTAIKLLSYESDVLVLVGNPNQTLKINYIDKINNKIGDKLDMPNELMKESLQAKVIAGDGYDFYIKNTIGLYGCNIGAEPVQVVNWINSDIIGSDISLLEILSPSEFVYMGIEFRASGHKYEVGKFTLISKDEYVEKKILTFAKMHELYELDRLIVNFNKRSDEYRVVMKDYCNYDEEQRGTMLNADIAAGRIPDLFVYINNQYDETYPLQSYKNQGLFTDLLTMFDGGILSDIVLNAFTIDNKMYSLPTHIAAGGLLIGKKSNFSFTTWTPLEMIEYSKSLNEGQFLVEDLSQYTWNNRILNHYIDYENKTVTFDDEFKEIIKYYAENFKKPRDNFDRSKREEMIRDDTVLLLGRNFYEFGTLFELKQLFGEDIVFIGQPAMTGSGSVLQSTSYYSMSAQSEYPEGAWEFLKFYMSQEAEVIDSSTAWMHNIPITKNGLEKYTEYMTGITQARAESGAYYIFSNPMTEEDMETYEKYAKGWALYTVTREEIDEIMAMMATLQPDFVMDIEITGIFYGEIRPYLDNPTDEVYDNAMRIIKNRIELYLNEKY